MLSLRSTALILLVLCSSAFAKLEPLTFSPSQVQTTLEMLEKLGSKHYASVPLDDELSQAFLKNYLYSLDPGHVYFRAEDVRKFEKWKYTLDDALRQGDLSQGFAIYNLYAKRVSDRLNKNIAMLESGVEFDFTVDESIVYSDDEDDPWVETEEELDEIWRKRIKDSYLRLLLTDKEPEEIPGLLIKRFKTTLKRVEQSDAEDVHTLYMNAFTSLYDPHTTYYSPRQWENFNINMSLKLEGIGAVLQLTDETASVVRVIPGGPADKQGILAPEDKIVGVGQEDEEIQDVVGWRLDDIVDLIRGPKGSEVRLDIIPAKGESAGTNRIITIVRDEVKLEEQAAKSRILKFKQDGRVYRVGVIDLPAFYSDFDAYNRKDPNYKSTARDVANLLQELQKQKVDGVILDLRNNGGGSLQEVVRTTDLFINPGPVVQIRKNNQIFPGYRSRSKPVYDGPLLVLINRLSASASEILAGAIQDYGRGLVVGTQSYGKGTVQALLPLHEGQIKLTESKFYRVSGDSTQHRGVLPDITLPSIYNVEDIGESSQEYALPWDQVRAIPVPRHGNFAPLLDELRTRYESRAAADPDHVFLLKELELNRQRREKKELSLNLEKRRQEQLDYETALFELHNARRVAKSQPPYESIEAWRAAEKSGNDDEERNGGADRHRPLEDDPLLKEAGLILVDQITLAPQGVPAVEVVEQAQP